VHVSNLRRKLDPDKPDPPRIETVQGLVTGCAACARGRHRGEYRTDAGPGGGQRAITDGRNEDQ